MDDEQLIEHMAQCIEDLLPKHGPDWLLKQLDAILETAAERVQEI